VASTKLVQFVHLSGFKFHFPHIVLTVALMGGIVSQFIAYEGHYSWRSPLNVVGFKLWTFFEYFPLGFAATMGVLMGLYFRELTLLTSVQSVPGLNILRWPAVISIACVWVMITITGGLYAYPDLIIGINDIPGPIYPVEFAFIVVILVMQLFLVGLGSLSILKSLGQGSQNKASLVKVIVISVSSAVLLTSFGIAFSALRMTFFNPWGLPNFYAFIGIYEMFGNFIPILCMILFSMCFELKTSKEIEISKSGTSSTSSTGVSKSKSSSSSSSGLNPVIEL